ncbi:hypothetical protein G6F57_019773 [Rhizopus arrhizus]|nr:hypothetical protein G6F57_019773 [Rhizopus arrhizus]
MAQLGDAQQRALKDCAAPEASEDRVALAQAHGMPPLQAIGWPRDPMWRNILAQLVDEVSRGKNVPAAAIEVCAALRRAVDEDPESLEDLAEAVLAEQDQGVDSAAAPFVMAALQVYWTDLASRFDDKQLPVVSPFGVCPVCASLPGASVVRPVRRAMAHGAREVHALRRRGIGGVPSHRRPLARHQGRDLRPLPHVPPDLLSGQ